MLHDARTLLEQAQAECARLLAADRHRLDAMAQALLEREVLSGDHLKALLGDRAPVPTAAA